MGIKNLMVLIKKYAPDAIKYKRINNYKNSYIGIDANLLIYKMVFAIRKNGYDIKNGEIIVTHIHSLLLKLTGFLKYNIIPIFVFDGMAPDIKKETLKKRKEFQNLMKIKYYKAVTQDEKKKYYFMKSNITYEEIVDCVTLIELFGYNVIVSPEEADSQLAELSKKGKVDYIVTDDLDILIFGGGKILKDFSIDKKRTIQEINLEIIKKNFKINQSQLIDLGILLGCDYCPSIKGIGTIGAFKLLQEFYSLNNIIKNIDMKITFNYKGAREYFENPPIVQVDTIEIYKKDINLKNLKNFLEKFNFNENYTNNLIEKIKRYS